MPEQKVAKLIRFQQRDAEVLCKKKHKDLNLRRCAPECLPVAGIQARIKAIMKVRLWRAFK